MSFEQPNFDAPPVKQQDRQLEKPKPGKEIQYSASLNFRSADGNFDILRSSDRELTNEDIANGFYSRQDKMNFSFSRVFEGLPLQLSDPKREMSPERKVVVESLRAGRPTFLLLDKAKIDDGFARASGQFTEARPGAILFPESGTVMNQFSAIEYPDGRIARMMRGAKRDNPDDFVRRANLLTPKMEAKEIDKKEAAYAMEFVQDGERPKKITQQEMEDWLVSVKESGLIFGFDVGENDPSLDNFVRKENKLFWVDGNILGANLAQNEEELNSFVEIQRKILGKYIKE